MRHNTPAALAVVAGTALAMALLVSGCATKGDARAETATPRADAGVNPISHDRDAWMQLLREHTLIRRSVTYTANGVDAVTESDDPAVAARIRAHAQAMQARIKAGARVRVWDPVFADLFEKHGAVRLEVTPTDRGVRIAESSDDPEAVRLLWSHAAGVSEFVREGPPANRRATRRIEGATPPPPEVAIGGVSHRVLLAQPDAGALAALKAEGVSGVVNFRQEKEHPDYVEGQACRDADLGYANLGYKDPVELTDSLLDAARAALRDADAGGRATAMHCRTGNRVGPAWIAWRTLDQGVPLEQAVGEAKMMRMVDARYEAIARDYVRRRQAEAPSK